MNIKFLGTSFGAPSVGRHQQSILVETGEKAYLVDTGAPVLDILVNDNYDITKIKAVFITHLHGDHMNGLFDILNLVDFYKMNLEVYLPEQRGIDLFQIYCDTQGIGNQNGRISFHLIHSGGFYDDGDLRIKAINTDHMEFSKKPSYGFFLEDNGSKVYITGDLHYTLKDFPELLFNEAVDLIVTECAHFTSEYLFEKLKKCNSKAVAIIHVMPVEKYDDLKKCAQKANFEVVLPNDNDEFNI